MNFIFDASLVSADRMDGINRYSVAMLKRISVPNMWHIANYRVARKFGLKRVVRVPVALSLPNTKGNLLRLMWKTFVLPFVLLGLGITLYYSPTHEGQSIPVSRQIITVHDLLPFLFPQTFSRLKYYFRMFFPIWVAFSDAIICVSKATQRDLYAWYPNTKKSVVVYEGVEIALSDAGGVGRSMGVEKLERIISGKFLLMVSEQRLYKNIENGIRGFAASRVAENHTLVLVGKPNRGTQDLMSIPAELGISDKVIFTGFVSDDDLGKLYRSATGFLFPSLYEGFGLPLLEAMTYGCICFASASSSLLEIGENAAIFFDPKDPMDIAQKIDNALIDSSKAELMALREKSRVQASRFSFDEAAKKIREVIDEHARPK